MSEIRQLPEQLERVETGPTRFGNDWCGVFIRGDNAFGYALDLQIALGEEKFENTHTALSLRRLLILLQSCDERRPA